MEASLKTQENKSPKDIITLIMGIFALVVLCVFPVVFHNYYFDMLATKYQFYSVAAIAMMVIMLAYGLYSEKVIDYLKDIKWKSMIKGLSAADWAVLAFWFANIMSWIVSPWRWEAFWGTSGRYNGVFLMTIYMLVYFLVTRFFELKRIYLDAFLLTGIFVCLFGITDYFQMDLLGFKVNMYDEQKHMYTSTLGNINNYTAYVGAVLCVSTILFTLEKSWKKMLYYFAVMAITMVALIVGSSDNAYLSLAALFGLSPLYLFQKKSWIRKYLAALATFLSACMFVSWTRHAFAGSILNVDSIFMLFSSSSMLPIIMILLWVAVAGWAFVDRKHKGTDEIGKGLRYAWIAVIVAVVAVVAYVLYDANIAGNAEKYEAIRGYVVFDDSWGNSRGYIWKRAWIIFTDILTPVQKLFGYGADTFKLLVIRYFPTNESSVFDNAHNEYLHFLVTVGIAGMTSYLAILVSSVVKMAKRAKESPEVVAAMFVVLAYATQAVVNINMPIVFPITWQFLAMGLSKLPKEDEKLPDEKENLPKEKEQLTEEGKDNKMATKKVPKNENKDIVKKNEPVEIAPMLTKIMGIFALAVLIVHPLIFDNAYFNILETKYLSYCGMVFSMIVLLVGYGIYSGKIAEFFKNINVGEMIKGFSLVDWAVIAFWLANVLSWVFCSKWRHEAFWGTSGRYNGVFLMTLYVIVYFCVSRFFEFKKWYLEVFLVVGLIVCLFGITDYFQMDILNFKVRMLETQKDKYTSTLGNINTYTVYVAAVMVMSTILFATETNLKKIVWYYVVMGISCAALIMGISDNAYLSLAALFGLSPLYLFRTKTGLSRYLISVATFFTVILGINQINIAFEDTVIGIDSAFAIIAGMKSLPLIVAALWAVAAAVTFALCKKNAGHDSEKLPKWLIYIWWGVIALVIGAVAFAFYDATVAGNSARYGALASYVTFNDEWGTNRGYVWKYAAEIWSEKTTLLQKLFGYGADTFKLIMYSSYSMETFANASVIYDSVHNEYLNFLLTIGIVGVGAYLLAIFAAIAKMWKYMDENPAVAAIVFVTLAYMTQAMINIFLPVIIPTFLQLLVMGYALVRKQEKLKEK